MLQFVLRCIRVRVRMGDQARAGGKLIRHAMRRPAGLAMRPPVLPAAPPPPAVAPPPTGREFMPPESPRFVPGLLFYPPQGVSDLQPARDRLVTERAPPIADVQRPVVPGTPVSPRVRGLPVAEPSSIAVFTVGLMVLAMLGRRAR